MPERVPQSVSKLVVFRAYLSSDHATPATGKTIAITISKNGAAFGNPNVGALNATEMTSGFYKFTLDTTDTGTAGPLAWRGAVATIDDAADVYDVVDAHNAGFDGVPGVAAEGAGGLYTRGTGAGQIKQTNNGEIDSNATHVNNVATTPVTTIKAVLGLAVDGVIPTATNLTNAPTVGDLTAAMKASVQTAADAAITANALVLEIEAETDDIQTRIPAALTIAGNMKSDSLAINGSTAAASNQANACLVNFVGSVTGAATTTTLIDSTLTQADTDFWKGRIVIFLTGNQKFQATDILNFDTVNHKLTFTAVTTAPALNDTYIII